MMNKLYWWCIRNMKWLCAALLGLLAFGFYLITRLLACYPLPALLLCAYSWRCLCP